MALSTNTDSFKFAIQNIKVLDSKESFNLWSLRVKSALSQCNLWDIKADLPINTDTSQSVLISLISDDLIEQVIDTDLKASTIWIHFKSTFITSTLSAQSSALNTLIDFRYDGENMINNKTKFLALKRTLKSSFNGQDYIAIDELVTLFALVNLPLSFQPLRTTLEETSKDGLSFENLFGSLIREESAQRSAANYTARQSNAKSSTTSKLFITKTRRSLAQSFGFTHCKHRRPSSTCWTCNPSLKPTCDTCKSLGCDKFNHIENSDFCKFQQFKSTKSSTNSSSTRSIRFNVDSGSTDTLVRNKEDIQIYSSLVHPIEVASGNIIHATAIGKLPGPIINLDQVLVVPEVTQNLLSTSKLDDQGFDTLFSKGKVYIGKEFSVGKVLLSGSRSSNVYHVDFPLETNSSSSAHAYDSHYSLDAPSISAKAFLLDEWHLKFNHLNKQDLLKLCKNHMVNGLDFKPNDDLSCCESCLIGKARKGSAPSFAVHKATRIGELIHTDVCGPIRPISNSGFMYFLTLIDDYSRYTTVYCLKSKADVFSKFQNFDQQLFNRTQRHTTYLRSDNGGEFKNTTFSVYCSKFGIIQEFSIPYNPSQNGVAERANLTLLNPVRAMLHESQLDKSFWDEALLNAVYTRNLSPISANDSMTPYQIWFGMKPSVSHLRIFGSTCFVFSPLSHRQKTGFTKLADRSVKCKFLGYCIDSKGYRLLNASNKIMTAPYHDVVFASIKSPDDLPPKAIATSKFVEFNPRSIVGFDGISPSPSDDEESFHSVSDGTLSLLDEDVPTMEDALVLDPKLTPISDRPGHFKHPTQGIVTLEPIETAPLKDITALPTSLKRIRPPVDYSSAFSARSASFTECLLSTEDMINLLDFQWYKLPSSKAFSASRDSLPIKYDDIAKLENSDQWYKATNSEIASLIEHGTWELVPLPEGRQAINCKWVFRIKRDANGDITRYKARLCACGYSQLPGIDYKDIYSPVVRSESLRLMLSIVASRNMELHQMDVVTAFLNGNLEETIFMKQPPGYEDLSHPNHVCQLHKNLYGLKQAPRVWHKTIDPFLKSKGFQAIDPDPCLYVKWLAQRLILIALYVDDLAIAADSDSDLDDIKSALNDRFKMTDEGELEFILGIKVRRDRANRAIYLSNEHYITELLSDFNMLTCNPISTPMEALTISALDCPTPHSDEWKRMQTVPYRQCVGRLTYLSRSSRPDIAYSVSVVNRYLHNPGERHWSAVKRILRYLKGTSIFELRLQPLSLKIFASTCDRSSSLEGPTKLSGNTDADWGGNIDNAKSTSGYAFYIGSSLVSWASKAQPTTATSSTHAEYIAAYHATAECIWLRSFLSALKMLPSQATAIYCDNEPAINIAKYHMVTPRSKHFDTKYHFIREQVEAGTVSLQFCPGKDNVADIFTKPLLKHRFAKFRQELGLLSRS